MKRLIALGAMFTGLVVAGLPAAAAAPLVPAAQVDSGVTPAAPAS